MNGLLPGFGLCSQTEKIIEQQFELGDPEQHLPHHRRDHSMAVRLCGRKICEIIEPYNIRLYSIADTAAAGHDIAHYDHIKDTDYPAELLQRKRVPDSSGMAELDSAEAVERYLAQTMHGRDFIDATKGAIYNGTWYEFKDGVLVHHLLPEALDVKAAFAVGAADLLVIAMQQLSNEQMTNAALRLLLERYPDLYIYIVSNRGQALPADTFDVLKNNILPAYAEEEDRFMKSQIMRLRIDADIAGLTHQKQLAIMELFDTPRFLQANSMEAWNEWTGDPEQMAKRLLAALGKMVIRAN